MLEPVWYTKQMIIKVGSKNRIKVQSVMDAIQLYPNIFTSPEVIGVDVNVEEFGHPKNLEETTKGAINRAREAYNECKR